MKHKHIMLDLETFSTQPYASVIAVGAVWFDPNVVGDEAIKGRFYVTISPEQSQKAGFHVDAGTVCWWLKPAQRPAWDNFLSLLHFSPSDALIGFTQWLDLLDEQDPPEPMPPDDDGLPNRDHRLLWGNGPGFDNELLRQTFKVLGMRQPWGHIGDRCFRTIKSLPRAAAVKPGPVGVQHNGVDDAEYQARWMCNIIRDNGIHF